MNRRDAAMLAIGFLLALSLGMNAEQYILKGGRFAMGYSGADSTARVILVDKYGRVIVSPEH